jgi:hypothetical protein
MTGRFLQYSLTARSLARMLLIPGQVHQAMGFQGTVFRPMRSAKGTGRDSSSAEKFDERQILIGGRLRAGMTGQRTAAGRSFSFGKSLGINAQKGAHVTILSPAFSSLPKNFRQTAGCRPVSHPVAGAKRVPAHKGEKPQQMTRSQRKLELRPITWRKPRAFHDNRK